LDALRFFAQEDQEDEVVFANIVHNRTSQGLQVNGGMDASALQVNSGWVYLTGAEASRHGYVAR